MPCFTFEPFQVYTGRFLYPSACMSFLHLTARTLPGGHKLAKNGGGGVARMYDNHRVPKDFHRTYKLKQHPYPHATQRGDQHRCSDGSYGRRSRDDAGQTAMSVYRPRAPTPFRLQKWNTRQDTGEKSKKQNGRYTSATSALLRGSLTRPTQFEDRSIHRPLHAPPFLPCRKL